jgi:hypothetical protein
MDPSAESLMNLAYLHDRLPTSQDVLHGLAEIEAALAEERKSPRLRQAFFGYGNFVAAIGLFFILSPSNTAGGTGSNITVLTFRKILPPQAVRPPLFEIPNITSCH